MCRECKYDTDIGAGKKRLIGADHRNQYRVQAERGII